MKSRFLMAGALVPVAYLAVVAFHPGIAFASRATDMRGMQSANEVGDYTIDPMHTAIGFEIEHFGLSHVQGRFDKLSGHIHADPKNMKNSKVGFTIQTESVDTNVAPRDADLRSPNFFDVKTFPEINFVSTSVKKHGKDYIATGDLTMHGVTKTISIPFKLNGPIKDPTGTIRAGIIVAPFQLNREDYGMRYDAPPLLGNSVTVRISLEGTLDK